MIKLYDYELSGNCYKIRLMLNILGLEHETVGIDFYPGNEHQSAAFKRVNPLGQLPVLDDGDYRVRDAQAILGYLARAYDAADQWYPVQHAKRLGQINQWLAFADMLTATASAARLHDGLNYKHIDINTARAEAHELFRVMDEHLWFGERDQQDWVVSGDTPTIADIACFPYTMLAAEGGVELQDYPTIRRWTDRVKRLPGFILMPGIFPTSDPV